MVSDPVAKQLFAYQQADVLHLAQIKRGLLLNEQGLGKTPVSISTLRLLSNSGENVLPALIVCKNNMKMMWKREFETWWPGVIVEVLEGTKAQRVQQVDRVLNGEAQVLVVNWEGLRGHSRLAPYGSIRLRSCVRCSPVPTDGMSDADIRKSENACERCPRELNQVTWRAIIADEAHSAKNPAAKQTRALWALRSDETVVRFALTGTPIADAPDDLWSSLHFIDPVQFPAKTKFVDRWVQVTYNPFGASTAVGLRPETKAEFFSVVDPLIRRVPKDLVLTQLPPKLNTVRYLDWSPKQRKAYEQMRDDMVAELEAEIAETDRVVATSPMTQHLRLGQFACAYAEIVEDGKVQLTEPSNKLDALEEILDELLGKPCVVFSQSRQLIELAAVRLEKLGVSYSMVVGNQKAAERQANIDRFQNGRTQVMLATIQAGGTGITLTRADTMVFLSRSWSNVDNQQAEARCHRVGSEVHESVTIIDLVTRGSVEEGQRAALGAKQGRLEEITRDRELMLKLLKGSA